MAATSVPKAPVLVIYADVPVPIGTYPSHDSVRVSICSGDEAVCMVSCERRRQRVEMVLRIRRRTHLG